MLLGWINGTQDMTQDNKGTELHAQKAADDVSSSSGH